jgi:hypothetical protein
MFKELKSSTCQYLLYFSIALTIVLLMGPHGAEHLAQGTLVNPDSYMRLVRIQEALDHGRWFGDVVSGDVSGQGDVLPWSHLLDGLILLLRAPLRAIFQPDKALLWAGAISGPLSVGLLGVAGAWAVAPIAERAWLWIVPVGVAVAPATISYGQFGCVTHHLALAVLVVAAWGAGGRAAFGSVWGGGLTGLFAGIGIWLSPEAMPFGMMALGAVYLSWATRPVAPVALALAAGGSALLASIAFALIVDPPFTGRAAPQLDRLSITFLYLALITCALCWIPRGLMRIRLAVSARFGIVGFGLVAGLALWLALFPAYLHGLGALTTPEEAEVMSTFALEWRPLDTPNLFAMYALTGVLAVIGAVWLAIQQDRDLPRILWTFAALCGAACTGLAILHGRFGLYPAVAAAMLLPVIRSSPAVLRRGLAVRAGLVAGFFYVPYTVATVRDAARMVLGTVPSVEAEAYGARKADRCPVRSAATVLASYFGAVVLADVDDGPELLFRTHVGIVGSLYHSGAAGFMRARAAWRARELDDVPSELRATGAKYVLVCPGSPRTTLVDGPTTTLFDRLNDGDPPAWLHPLAHQPGSGWMIYEIASTH